MVSLNAVQKSPIYRRFHVVFESNLESHELFSFVRGPKSALPLVFPTSEIMSTKTVGEKASINTYYGSGSEGSVMWLQ
jgi:hypothetical protein